MAGRDPQALAQTQRWFLSVITHPDGAEHDAEAVRTNLTASRRLDAVGRLQVYADAYFARLLECMRSSFPLTVRTLGAELFDQFAFGYLKETPSRSYTLNRLGDRFADWMNESRPEEIGPDAGWADFLVELIRFEWEIDQVFDGPGSEQLAPFPPEAASRLQPNDRLVTSPSLRLLHYDYPVNDYFSEARQIEHDDDLGVPEPRESFVALVRRDWIVRRLELSRAQYELLQALQRGATIAAAIEQAAAHLEPAVDPEGEASLAESLGSWFRDWMGERLFVSSA